MTTECTGTCTWRKTSILWLLGHSWEQSRKTRDLQITSDPNREVEKKLWEHLAAARNDRLVFFWIKQTALLHELVSRSSNLVKYPLDKPFFASRNYNSSPRWHTMTPECAPLENYIPHEGLPTTSEGWPSEFRGRGIQPLLGNRRIPKSISDRWI